MTFNATQRNVRSLMKRINAEEPLNILTCTTHERYEANLCRTGHNFFAMNIPNQKTWDETYAPIPSNYTQLDYIPDHIDFDLVLSHTSCGRLKAMHDVLAMQRNSPTIDRLAIPILRHTHVLPDVRMDIETQKKGMQSIKVDHDSFISYYNRDAWGFGEESSVVEHGIDTEYFKPMGIERRNALLSVVNGWPDRDWCCGFNLWKQTTQGLPVMPVGKSPGFSEPARETDHLRQIYNSFSIFYNTSLHSPVPTVLLEAMACGCAIVSTANCMIPEIIVNGKNGLISNDPQELRNHCELLLNNPILARKLGDAARQTIVDYYGLDRFIDDWNKLFFKVIKDKKGIA